MARSLHRFRKETLDSACVTPREASVGATLSGACFAAHSMLRILGESATTLVERARRLRRSITAVVDIRYYRERGEFIRRARRFLPWLSPVHLSYLAFFADDTHTPGNKRWIDRQLVSQIQFSLGDGDPSSSRAERDYCVFSQVASVRLPGLRRLGQLRSFRPEPVWIRKTIPRSGCRKPRVLHIPNIPLKQLQRFILRAYLDRLEVDGAAYGFEPGRSRRAHAAHHCGKQVVIRLDLQNFFHSIRTAAVVPLFRECGFHGRFARTLAALVTYHGRVPLGAPTSPKVADLVVRPLDRDLRELARTRHWFYSRYADDLCFSSRRRLGRHAIDKFIADVERVVITYGFALNRRKTRVMRPHQRQAVVGAVVNDQRPRARREQRRLLRALLDRSEKNGLLAEGRRYSEVLKASGVEPRVIKGRHPGELVRADRAWPYSRQVAHLPQTLREATTAMPDQDWTAVTDFWNYICGNVGEVVSLEPDLRTEFRQRLRRLPVFKPTDSDHVPPSLDVKQQPIVDHWREISDLVAEANKHWRHSAVQLIGFSPLTPVAQRHIAECEDDFLIFVITAYKQLCDSIDRRYKKSVFDWFPAGLGAVAPLRHFFAHKQKTDERADKANETLKEVHRIFRGLIGKDFPEEPPEWYKAQLELLRAVVKDLHMLRGWKPPASPRESDVGPKS